MSDLTEFLLMRIAEDEAIARDAHYEGQRWYAEEETVGRWPEICDCDCPVKYAANRKIEAEHIANWDPARVLAECEAKRRIVELFTWVNPLVESDTRHVRSDDSDSFEQALCLLALPYANHPDYDEAWRP